jgi:hypothetical protein
LRFFSVCLALAQQLTIKKALADGMKKGIVAKLSAEVRSFSGA